MKRTYEIHNLTTNEILADNLTFEGVPELFEAYTLFCPNDEIVVYYREEIIKRPNRVIQVNIIGYSDFRTEWLNLIDELCQLGNIY